MEMRTWLLIGAGVAALGVGAVVLSSRGATASPAPVTDIGSYMPPISMGGGGGGIDPGGLNQSGSYGTDTSIASIIASNLSIAQLQSTTTLESARISKDVALAGYANEQAIAKDDNTTKLSLQSLINGGQQAMATIMGTNERELAKVVGSNEQTLATISGSNAVNLVNASGTQNLALQTQKDMTAMTLAAFAEIGKGGGKVNLPGPGGVLTVKQIRH